MAGRRGAVLRRTACTIRTCSTASRRTTHPTWANMSRRWASSPKAADTGERERAGERSSAALFRCPRRPPTSRLRDPAADRSISVPRPAPSGPLGRAPIVADDLGGADRAQPQRVGVERAVVRQRRAGNPRRTGRPRRSCRRPRRPARPRRVARSPPSIATAPSRAARHDEQRHLAGQLRQRRLDVVGLGERQSAPPRWRTGCRSSPSSISARKSSPWRFRCRNVAETLNATLRPCVARDPDRPLHRRARLLRIPQIAFEVAGSWRCAIIVARRARRRAGTATRRGRCSSSAAPSGRDEDQAARRWSARRARRHVGNSTPAGA